jgi:hypothetical protein
MNSVCYQWPIRVRSPIAEELPGVSHLSNQIKIQIGNYQRVLITRRLGYQLTTRVAKVTLSIKLADVPGLFMAHPVYRPDEIAVRNSVCRLFQLP